MSTKIERAPLTDEAANSAQSNTHHGQDTTPAASRQELLEGIRRYVDRVPLDNAEKRKYDLQIKECLALREYAQERLIEAIILAFEYGRAKGHRAERKAAGRRG